LSKGKKMEIVVSSRQAVCGVIQKIQKDKPDIKVICVSITDPKSEPVNLPLLDLDILRLQFHDLDQTYPISGPAIVLFNTDMAHEIKGFMEERIDWVENSSFGVDDLIIVVHCEAGISRSAGVAGALAKHFFGNDDIFFRSPYLPNRLTYSILLNLLSGKENQIPNVIICNEDSNVF